VYAALLAAVLTAIGQLLGWAGVDVAAQVHRVDSFRSSGFSLWDFQWYGGHWTFDYSVGYPPLAALVGWRALTVISAAVAALAFDALARRHFATAGLVVSLIFAAGTLVQASIGQLPFLLGEAFGLCALWAGSRGRPALAGALAFAAGLSSPLAAAFTALAAAAWLIGLRGCPGGRRRTAAGLAIAGGALVPIAVTSVLFPGQGPMPYPVVDWAWEMAVACGIFLAAGRTERVIRAGAALFAIAATLSFAVPSPLGGNVGRLEDVAALPLAVGLLWLRPALVLGIATFPLVMSQWSPAWGAVESSSTVASTHKSFFAPLDAVLHRIQPGPAAGRIEVVPTEYHWESAYVAEVMPLARGWERQLDVADNPLFYEPGALTPAAYRHWLIDNGVQLVALPLAPIDEAGRAEARLVTSGLVPGLVRIWINPDWELFRVVDSPGIVSGPARLLSISDGSVLLNAEAPGSVTVRIRFNSDWTLSGGAGCVTSAGGRWIVVDVPGAERFRLSLSIGGDGAARCESAAARFGPATTAAAAIGAGS
jgi:hypothetical protein